MDARARYSNRQQSGKEIIMALFSLDSGLTGSRSITSSFFAPVAAFLVGVSSRWQAYRDLQALGQVPFEVMKDVGFPGAERMNDL
jgi:hypothetical protein